MLCRSAVIIALCCVAAAPASASDPEPDVVSPDIARLSLSQRPQRPFVLPMLYAGFATLQVFDGYSTMHAVRAGAQEMNPLVQVIVDRPVAFWSVKAATTIAPMIVAERMWKRNKAGAIVVMAVSNGLMAAIAMQNAKVLQRQR